LKSSIPADVGIEAAPARDRRERLPGDSARGARERVGGQRERGTEGAARTLGAGDVVRLDECRLVPLRHPLLVPVGGVVAAAVPLHSLPHEVRGRAADADLHPADLVVERPGRGRANLDLAARGDRRGLHGDRDGEIGAPEELEHRAAV
jgi:hypothetical protein